MKSFKPFWILGLLVLLVSATTGTAVGQPGPRASFQTFYDELEPYGQWMRHPRYGYVWLPDAGPDFQPYATNGQWVVTEYGNTWVSDYAWGWAPFHYGRWFYDDLYGWTWVPDQEWGPAWVSWRNGGGYYGWAPLGPGMDIYSYDIPANHWCFVPEVYIIRPRIFNYCVPRTRVVYIYRNTRHLNNIHRYGNRDYVYGPRRDEIERVTRSRVNVYQVYADGRPGQAHVQDRTIRIYRPEVSNNQKERPQPRNLSGNSGRQNNSSFQEDRDLMRNGEAVNSGRLRMDRSASTGNSASVTNREQRNPDGQAGTNRGDQLMRNYPERDYPRLRPEQNTQQQVPDRAPAGYRREQSGQAASQSRTPQRTSRYSQGEGQQAPSTRQTVYPRQDKTIDQQGGGSRLERERPRAATLEGPGRSRQ